MSHTRSVLRSILKWTGIATIAILFLFLGYLVFFLPESVDHTFDLSNKRQITVYQSGNIDFGFEHFEGGNRQGYRIKAGHLRMRYEEPAPVWLGVKF